MYSKSKIPILAKVLCFSFIVIILTEMSYYGSNLGCFFLRYPVFNSHSTHGTNSHSNNGPRLHHGKKIARRDVWEQEAMQFARTVVLQRWQQ